MSEIISVNYAERIQETSPENALHGKSIVGIYFRRESCPHWGPFLQSLKALLWHCSKTTIVIVSRGASEEDTDRYFYNMPRWNAMPHDAAAGPRGKALMERFGVTTIPALVLLDGNDRVICTDARIRLAADPTGLEFPWPAPAGPRRKKPTVAFAVGPPGGPRSVGDRAHCQPAPFPFQEKAGAIPRAAPSSLRLPCPPDGDLPPSFTEDKHKMAWHDQVIIDQDLAQLVV